MAKPKIELAEYGLLIDTNICRMFVELSKQDADKYRLFSLALFKWVGAGCPEPISTHIPKELPLESQSLLERLFSEHIGRWKSYNAHRRNL